MDRRTGQKNASSDNDNDNDRRFPAHDELGTCRTSFAIHNSVGEWMSITDLLHGFLCKARKGLAPEVVVAQGEVGDVRG